MNDDHAAVDSELPSTHKLIQISENENPSQLTRIQRLMQIDRPRHYEVPENTIALMIWQRKVAGEHITWGQPTHGAASVNSNFLCDGDAKVFDAIWQGRVLESAAGDDGIENTSQSPVGSCEFKL